MPGLFVCSVFVFWLSPVLSAVRSAVTQVGVDDDELIRIIHDTSRSRLMMN